MPISLRLSRMASACFLSLGLLCAFTLICAGCGRGAQDDPQSGPDGKSIGLPTMEAREFLQQVLARYRSTRSYRDRGEVRMSVEKDGRLTRQVAPMHVWIDGSTIWLAVYDARLWSDSERTLGWIADEQTDRFDSQVVVGGPAADAKASARPLLENLLRDPLLTSRMISGLGGPPPQLEWLLEGEPMAKLFAQGEGAELTESIQYQGVQSRDGIECVVVTAVAGSDQYRFWIDPRRSLIHSVDLPVSMAGESIHLEGWTVHSLELVLKDASFEPPSTPYQFLAMPKAELPERPKYVSALVPLPPERPDSNLGRSIGRLDCRDVSGQVRLTERGADRPFTLWFACPPDDDEDSEYHTLESVAAIASALSRTPESLSSRIRCVALTEPQSRQSLAEAGLPSAGWILVDDTKFGVAKRLGLVPGKAALADPRGRLVWLGTPMSGAMPSPDLGLLGAITTDVLTGVDVPMRIRKAWEVDRQAYQEKIDELSLE